MAALVVDDDPLVRIFVTTLLEDLGNEVFAAESGEEAIAFFDNEDMPFPEVVILDLTLPGIDGFETGSLLKQKAGESHLPIIFLTAYDEPGVLSRCLAIGDDFISKPCSVEVVSAKVDAHKRTSQLYQQLDNQYTDLKRYHAQVSVEHDLVDSIFRRYLENNIISAEHFRYHISPTSVFNGDILLAARGPAGNLYVLVGDVTGHGLPAAVGAMPIYSAFSAMTSKGLSVGAIAAELNKILCETLPDNMMVATNLLELNASGNQLTVWAGGLPAAILADSRGNIKLRIESAHCPLGMLEEFEFSQDIQIFPVSADDYVYLYTDGVEESRNAKGEMFSEPRLHALFDGNSPDMYQKILDDLASFSGGIEQDDDITLVALHCAVDDSLEAIKDQQRVRGLPWSMSFKLTVNEIKGSSPVPQIIRLLSNAVGVDVHQDYISTILSELYANALDHGLLGMDSAIKATDDGFIEYYMLRKERLDSLGEGEIVITLSLSHNLEGSFVAIEVQDSGNGFDLDSLAKRQDQATDDDAHGRGAGIVRELCESVEYSKGGTCVTAIYRL